MLTKPATPGSVLFFAAAMWLGVPGIARGEEPGKAPGNHLSIQENSTLTPEQIRAALGQLKNHLPQGIEGQILGKLSQRFPTSTQDELKSLIRDAVKNPQFQDELNKAIKRHEGSDSLPTADLSKLLDGIQGMVPGGPGSFRPGDPPDNPGVPVGPRSAPPLPPRGEPRGLPEPEPADPAGPMPRDLPMRLGRGGGPDSMGFPMRGHEPALDPAKQRAVQALAGLWSQNIGPIEKTPAVQRALVDLVRHTGDLKDSSGNSIWESLSRETGDGSAFGEFLDDAGKSGSGWSWPDFDLPKFRWGSSRTDIGSGDSSSSSGDSWWSRRDRPSSSSSGRWGSGLGSGPNLGIPGLEGSWLPVVLLVAVVLGALLYWRFIYRKGANAEAAFDLGGLGSWPIDPRRIATRQDVVIAFEYLSVQICGPSAKMWTHNTIAGALSDLASTHAETAAMLARLYELARYAPIDEPLTIAELAEARRLVCRLAGLDDA